MGFYVRRRKRIGKNTHLNFSKKGVSATQRLGPLTLNSRGRVTLRLGKGIGFRIGN